MKKLTGLLSIAIIGAGIASSVPAQADTVYHRVYRQAYTVTDPFSILDIHHNNVLRAVEYKRGGNGYDFFSADLNKDGFISRSEFYRTGTVATRATDLTTIAPAAGDSMVVTRRYNNDIVYKDDPCDVTGYRNDLSCR